MARDVSPVALDVFHLTEENYFLENYRYGECCATAKSWVCDRSDPSWQAQIKQSRLFQFLGSDKTPGCVIPHGAIPSASEFSAIGGLFRRRKSDT